MAKPTKVPTWKAEPLVRRLAHCVAMLSIHGVLSDAERHKALDRIRKSFSTRVVTS
jgi:hypothetical protein